MQHVPVGSKDAIQAVTLLTFNLVTRNAESAYTIPFCLSEVQHIAVTLAYSKVQEILQALWNPNTTEWMLYVQI